MTLLDQSLFINVPAMAMSKVAAADVEREKTKSRKRPPPLHTQENQQSITFPLYKTYIPAAADNTPRKKNKKAFRKRQAAVTHFSITASPFVIREMTMTGQKRLFHSDFYFVVDAAEKKSLGELMNGFSGLKLADIIAARWQQRLRNSL